MKAPKNRRVYVIGYGAATPLGATFEKSWARAVKGESGFRKVTRCEVNSACNVVGEIPDWDPRALDFADEKEIYNWNADFVLLTMAVCQEAVRRSGLVIDATTGPRTACLIGSALNGSDAYRKAMDNYLSRGPLKVSPYLLPNLCANLPSGKAGMLLGFTGPIFAPEGACASGNHAIGIGARMIRDGDVDFVLAGGADTCIIPEIIHGFENMNATIKIKTGDRAHDDPAQASRPFSADRKGFVLSEGAGVVVLAADEAVRAYGLEPRAEVLGVGWNSDAHHFTRPNSETIIVCMKQAIDDAGLSPGDIQYVNAHGTSTPKGDATEIECIKEVFGTGIDKVPVSSNKSQIGHTLGGAAAIEAAFAIEGMQQGIILPTVNHIPDPLLSGVDVVPNQARKQSHEIIMSNAFGFGGTNCCVVFGGYNVKPKPFRPDAYNNDERFVRDRTTGDIWHRCTHRTLYADTDRSEVVYHSNYLRYFELGRASLMRDAAYPYREIEESGFVYPIIDLGITFYSPLYYDDLIWVHTRPIELERVRLKFDYLITHAETNRLICRGFTRHCALNKAGRPVAVDEKTVHLWKTFPK